MRGYEQTGYPVHSRPMPSAKGEKSPCQSALVLPVQGNLRADKCELYCTGCKVLLVAQEHEIRAARAAAKASGFVAGKASLRDPVDTKRKRAKAPEAAIPLFDDLNPNLRPDGTAR